MKIGFIGLGRMGSALVANLIDHKHEVVVYNRHKEKADHLGKIGAIPGYSIEELISKLPSQKIIWLMITAGKPVDEILSKLLPHLKKGDIIIDGGNSFFKDSIRRYNQLRKKGVQFLDCGTSGGIDGARNGACMMVGGDKSAFLKVEPILKDISVKNGYSYLGKSGSGHFVKMVHNGIEYGMLGALAEGMQIINEFDKTIDLKEVAKVYANGSIIEGKLTKWLHEIYQNPELLKIQGSVPKGETEEEMKKLEKIGNMKILKQSRLMRVKSRAKPSYSGKVISSIRNQFGGHKTNKEK